MSNHIVTMICGAGIALLVVTMEHLLHEWIYASARRRNCAADSK